MTDWQKLVFAIGLGAILLPSQLQSENWIFIETSVFPAGCLSLSECLDSTTKEQRNLVEMDDDETTMLLDLINELSDIQNVPPIPEITEPLDFQLADIVPRLQLLEVRGQADALKGLPGVYFDASRVAGEGTGDEFVAYFTQMITNAGIPILTEEEAAAMPGAARMAVSLSLTRDNAGCIFPFRATLSITEEVVLVRDPNIKLETSTWRVSVAENFANTNFLPTMALRDAANRFIDDYNAANATEG